MAVKRLLTEFDMCTFLRHQHSTKAASSAVKDALWHTIQSTRLNFAGKNKLDRQINLEVGRAPRHTTPMSSRRYSCFHKQSPRAQGGLDVMREDGGKPKVIANVTITLALDL